VVPQILETTTQGTKQQDKIWEYYVI